jgi:thiol:disulfide interchange protein DsbD
MKKVAFTLFFAALTSMVIGQMNNPVTWTYEAKKRSAGTYDIVLTADVAHPWHIYSQNTGKNGPVPTKISLKPNPLVTVSKGNAKELGKLEKTFDKNFDTDVLFFSDKVQFVKTVKVKGGIKTNLSGTVEYMVCDESKCLPPVKKTFDLKLL